MKKFVSSGEIIGQTEFALSYSLNCGYLTPAQRTLILASYAANKGLGDEVIEGRVDAEVIRKAVYICLSKLMKDVASQEFASLGVWWFV